MHYTRTDLRDRRMKAASILLESNGRLTHHKCKFLYLNNDFAASEFRMSPGGILELIYGSLKDATRGWNRRGVLTEYF